MAIHDPTTGPPDPEFADKLFSLVELDQGYAFISDGIHVLSRAEIIGVARGSLKHCRKVTRLLDEFIKQHAETTTEAADGK